MSLFECHQKSNVIIIILGVVFVFIVIIAGVLVYRALGDFHSGG